MHVAVSGDGGMGMLGEGHAVVGGVDNLTVIAGDQTDLMQGVTVTDSKLGDVTDKVKVLNSTDNESELTDLGVWDDFEDFNHNVAGVYTVYYRVTSSGITETKTREVTVQAGHNLSNGDFEMTNNSGFYNWSVDTPGANMELSKFPDTDGKTKPKFTITSSGNAWYGLQFINKANLEKDQSYRISVTARSATGKSVAFGFEDGTSFAMLQGLTVHKLTAETQTYVSFFTAGKSYVNAKAVLYMGKMLPTDVVESGASHEVVIDRINIEKIDKCPDVTFGGLDSITTKDATDLDLLSGVTAKNGETDLTDKIRVIGLVPAKVTENANHAVVYMIPNENGPIAFAIRSVRVEVAKEKPYDVINGDFSDGTNGWTPDVNAQNPGKATFETDENGAKITIQTPSSDGWHIQFRQDVRLTKNTNYIIKVTASASVDRSIVLEMGGKTQYALNLTAQTKEFEFAYVYKANDGGVRLSFLLGGGGSGNNDSVIHLNNVAVSLDPDQTQYEAYELINYDFDYGIKNWGYEGPVDFVDNKDSSVTAKITGETDAGWRIQLRQDNIGVEKDVTYVITVKAKAKVARAVNVEAYSVANGRPGLNVSTKFDLTTEEQEFTFEFTPTENRSDIRVGMLLGGAGTKDNDVTLSMFRITLKAA